MFELFVLYLLTRKQSKEDEAKENAGCAVLSLVVIVILIFCYVIHILGELAR